MPRESLTRMDVIGIGLTLLAIPLFLVVCYLFLTGIVSYRNLPPSPPMAPLAVATNAPASTK